MRSAVSGASVGSKHLPVLDRAQSMLQNCCMLQSVQPTACTARAESGNLNAHLWRSPRRTVNLAARYHAAQHPYKACAAPLHSGHSNARTGAPSRPQTGAGASRFPARKCAQHAASDATHAPACPVMGVRSSGAPSGARRGGRCRQGRGPATAGWRALRQMGQRARRRLHRRHMLAWPQGMSATCTGRTCAGGDRAGVSQSGMGRQAP